MRFPRRYVEPILAGRKTQTRRLWVRPHVAVGDVLPATVRREGRSVQFASLLVTGLRREPGTAISDADLRAEGYASRAVYLRDFAWASTGRRWRAGVVFVVEFRAVEEPPEGSATGQACYRPELPAGEWVDSRGERPGPQTGRYDAEQGGRGRSEDEVPRLSATVQA